MDVSDPELASAIAKQSQLFSILGAFDGMLIAFSGGADSAYLAWAAHKTIGSRAIAVTALSPSFAEFDRREAESFARFAGLRHEWMETREFENPSYVANQADRCYFCKDELFEEMEKIATARGISAIAYGINVDDTRDFRPGHRAASEHRILAPLLDAGLTKTEIRLLSRVAQLPTWDRPASACLSSRVPYGTPVTREILVRIEKSEAALRDLGFRQFRVRAHGDLARIEVGRDEIAHALSPEISQQLAARIKQAGFTFVTLDLEGYRQGSLNVLLGKK